MAASDGQPVATGNAEDESMKRRNRNVSTGQLINKLERCIAIANMRGDRAAAERFTKLLASAANSTQMKGVIA